MKKLLMVVLLFTATSLWAQSESPVGVNVTGNLNFGLKSSGMDEAGFVFE